MNSKLPKVTDDAGSTNVYLVLDEVQVPDIGDSLTTVISAHRTRAAAWDKMLRLQHGGDYAGELAIVAVELED